VAGAIGAIWLYFGLLDSGSAAPRQVDLERFGPALDGVRRRCAREIFVEHSGRPGCVVVASNLMARALYLTARPRPWFGSVRWDFGNQRPTCARGVFRRDSLAR
jgi:hypothetical protein